MSDLGLRTTYDERAKQYIYRGRRASPSRKHRGIIAHLPALEGKRFLEVGCGDGPYLVWASAHSACAVAGVDISPRILGEARRRVEHEGRSEFVRLATADAVALPFPSACFDVLLASQVIEHVPDDARALREMRRVLRAGGTLVISTDHRDNRVSQALAGPALALHRLLRRAEYHPPFLHRSYGRAEFTGMLRQAGFEVLHDCTFRFSWPWTLARVRLLTWLLDRAEERLIAYRPWSDWGDIALIVAR